MARPTEWESNPNNITVQTSMPSQAKAFTYLYNRMKAAGAQSWRTVYNRGWQSKGFVSNLENSLDNIRVPIKIKNTTTTVSAVFSTSESFNVGSLLDVAGIYGNDDNYYEWISIPRLYPVLKPLKQVLIDYQSNTDFVWVHRNIELLYGQTPETHGFNYNSRISYSEAIESCPDDLYVIDHLEQYTDKTNGEEQTLLSSINSTTTTGQAIIVGVPFRFTYGSYPGVVLVDMALSAISRRHDSDYATGAALYNNYPGYPFEIYTVMGAGNPDPNPVLDWFFNLSATTYSPKMTFQAAKKSVWNKLFDSSGYKWSYDLDAVMSPDDTRLRKPSTPGQPDNPVDIGSGDGDNISDDIEYPDVSYVPTAFSRYWIKPTDIIKLKEFLFSQTFFDNIQRLWENPGEYIVDLTYYPLLPAALGMAGEPEQIPIGNILSNVTGLIYPENGAQYHYMGSYHVEPYYNSYLDYSPYTSMSIYLPYIGIRPLDTSRITGHTLNVAYTFDFGTRQVTAHLGLDGMGGGDLGNALDSFTGSFGVTFPLSGSQNNQVALNVLQQTSQVITSAGALAGGIATGNAAAALGGALGLVSSPAAGKQLNPETYGTLTPTAGLYAPQVPYLIINRPITAEPGAWADEMGYSAGYSGKVSEFSGFLECKNANIPASGTMTEIEQKEIQTLLNGGVYI